tara:strand:- start:611 stop:907 length:297 start_codon:yes stop_codon:yes gene_type:complete
MIDKKAARFHVVKINTADFEANVTKNAEIALLHAEGWTIVDVQPIQERDKYFWMAVMAPPIEKGPYIIDPSSLLVAAPFMGLVAGITAALVLLIGGGA